jgi:hypothetical protein
MYAETKKTVITRGERAERVVHSDNLRLEGQINSVTTSQDDFRQTNQTRGERAEIVKHESSLVTEGRFEGKTMSQGDYTDHGRGERAEIIRHKDNLKVEGIPRVQSNSGGIIYFSLYYMFSFKCFLT